MTPTKVGGKENLMYCNQMGFVPKWDLFVTHILLTSVWHCLDLIVEELLR